MLFGGFEEPKRPRPKATLKDKLPHYTYQKGKCNGCQRDFPIDIMELDHIKPFSGGGVERTGNMQVLCTHCNKVKGKGTMKQLEKKLVAEGLIKAPAKTASKATTKTAATKKVAATKSAVKKKPTKKKNVDPFGGIFGF